MEAIGVAASIITVIHAASAVVAVCYDYKSALKSSPWGLTQITQEVKGLRNVLEMLEGVAENVESEKTASTKRRLETLRTLCRPGDGPLAMCLEELNSLERRLNSPSWKGKPETRRRALIEAVGWRFKEEDVKQSLQRIDRLKATLNLALTANDTNLLLDIKDTTLSINQASTRVERDVSNLLDGFVSMRLSERHERILRWLSPVDPDESHLAAVKIHQAGTCDWFIQSPEFAQWCHSNPSFLWLNGFPGTGKTILASSVVRALQESQSRHGGMVAYFYCDFRRPKSQNPVNVMGSIVAQLCLHLNFCPEELEEAFDRSTTASTGPKSPDFSILEAVLTILVHKRRTFVIIDGLDECTDREDILCLLSKLKNETLGLSMLIASRYEVDIRAAFEDSATVPIESRSLEMGRDINVYMHNRLENDKRLQWLKESVKEEIKEKLQAKAKGMFRWVQCQMDQLATLKTIKAIKKALGELPRGLDETYEAILTRIPDYNVETVRRILTWLAFTIRPLCLQLLHEAIAIEQELPYLDEEGRLSSPQDIIDICGNLVSASGNEVTLAHLSVKEYLLSPSIRCSRASSFALSAEEGNRQLTIDCLTYLTFDVFGSGPERTEEAFNNRMEQYPLLDHVAVSWPYHSILAGQPEDLNARIDHFFSDVMRHHFMSWVQVLNSDGLLHHWNFYPRHAHGLYYAASFGLDKIVRKLIDKGADLDAPGSRFDGTALHAAVLRNKIPVVRVLLEAGADPNKADGGRIYPLHTAAARGTNELIRLLLEYGARENVEDDKGATPYDWAVRARNNEAQSILHTGQRPHSRFAQSTPVFGVDTLCALRRADATPLSITEERPSNNSANSKPSMVYDFGPTEFTIHGA